MVIIHKKTRKNLLWNVLFSISWTDLIHQITFRLFYFHCNTLIYHKFKTNDSSNISFCAQVVLTPKHIPVMIKLPHFSVIIQIYLRYQRDVSNIVACVFYFQKSSVNWIPRALFTNSKYFKYNRRIYNVVNSEWLTMYWVGSHTSIFVFIESNKLLLFIYKPIKKFLFQPTVKVKL